MFYTYILLDAIAELANHDDDYSAQSAFILLRHSAAHKFTHLLRSAPPSLIEEAALAYDTSMTDCLAKILDRSSRDLFSEGSSPSASTQAALPTNLGGLGLSSAQVVSLPAYLASWIDFLRFNQQRPSFLPALSAVLSPDALASSPNREIACLRSVWDDLVSRLTRPDPSSGITIWDVETRLEILLAFWHGFSHFGIMTSWWHPVAPDVHFSIGFAYSRTSMYYTHKST